MEVAEASVVAEAVAVAVIVAEAAEEEDQAGVEAVVEVAVASVVVAEAAVAVTVAVAAVPEDEDQAVDGDHEGDKKNDKIYKNHKRKTYSNFGSIQIEKMGRSRSRSRERRRSRSRSPKKSSKSSSSLSRRENEGSSGSREARRERSPDRRAHRRDGHDDRDRKRSPPRYWIDLVTLENALKPASVTAKPAAVAAEVRWQKRAKTQLSGSKLWQSQSNRHIARRNWARL